MRLAWTLYRLQTVQEWPERQSIAAFNTILGGQEDLVAVKSSQSGAQASNRTVSAAFIAQSNAVESVTDAQTAAAEKVYSVVFHHNQLGKTRDGFPTPVDVWRMVVTGWAAGVCEAPLRWLQDEHERPLTLKKLAAAAEGANTNDERAVLAAFLGRYNVVPADQLPTGPGIETVELSDFLSSVGSEVTAGRLSQLLGAKLGLQHYKSRAVNTSQNGKQFRKYFVACLRRAAAPPATRAAPPPAASLMDASVWAAGSRRRPTLALISQHVLAAADDAPSYAQYKAIRRLNATLVHHLEEAGLPYLTDSDSSNDEEEPQKRQRV